VHWRSALAEHGDEKRDDDRKRDAAAPSANSFKEYPDLLHVSRLSLSSLPARSW
jgi:hypothetical protein